MFSNSYTQLISGIKNYFATQILDVVQINNPYDLEQNMKIKFGWGLSVGSLVSTNIFASRRSYQMMIVSEYIEKKGDVEHRINLEKQLIFHSQSCLKYISEKNCGLALQLVGDEGIQFTEGKKQIYVVVELSIIE